MLDMLLLVIGQAIGPGYGHFVIYFHYYHEPMPHMSSSRLLFNLKRLYKVKYAVPFANYGILLGC